MTLFHLFQAQELEKEQENSRRIVLALTERLMESREMINKLEMENVREKSHSSHFTIIANIETFRCTVFPKLDGLVTYRNYVGLEDQ